MCRGLGGWASRKVWTCLAIRPRESQRPCQSSSPTPSSLPTSGAAGGGGAELGVRRSWVGGWGTGIDVPQPGARVWGGRDRPLGRRPRPLAHAIPCLGGSARVLRAPELDRSRSALGGRKARRDPGATRRGAGLFRARPAHNVYYRARPRVTIACHANFGWLNSNLCRYDPSGLSCGCEM